MRVGSIVECVIPDKGNLSHIPTQIGDRYTIRGFNRDGCLLFEEISPIMWFDFDECGYVKTRFQEIILPPNLESEIKELLTIKEPALVGRE